MIVDAIGYVIDRDYGAEDIEALLTAEGRDLEELLGAAREVRDRRFGNRVFTYGFAYFSTHCRNDCAFCYYRASNGSTGRYRKDPDEIVDLACRLRDSGVDLIDLTMGEDEVMRRNGFEGFLDIVSRVDEAVDIGIMASPGTVPRELMSPLREAGADWLACYQETYDRGLFERIRPGQSFDIRRDQKTWAHEAGLLSEDGMMVGIGEDPGSRALSVMEMGSLGCDQVRAMAFVPQIGTPMSSRVPGSPEDEIRAIATMRLMFPGRLIPASLDVEGISGLMARLDAGANVVTSIVPDASLSGVAQHELDIGNGNRSVDHVFSVLGDCGFEPASLSEYRRWMDSRRGILT